MSKKLTNEEFLQKLKDLKIKYIPLEEYKGAQIKIKWLCYKNTKHIFEMTPSDIYKQIGCYYCSHKRVFVGETDLWTTNPDMARMLKNPEDGYKYSHSSRTIAEWICPNCGMEIKSSFDTVYAHGLSCHVCSDGLSYSEKFLISMLNQIGINFLHDKPLEWSHGKRYDFYIEEYNMIIECHGLQHYENKFKTYKDARNLSEEQQNDLFKKNMAIANGIINYIVLDCRKSDKGFIYNSIINSYLFSFFDLSKVNWDKCDKDSQKSYYATILKYYNNNIKNPVEISKQTGIGYNSVLNALHKMTKNGLCVYDSKESSKLYALKNQSKKVICLETGKVYNSVRNTIQDGFEETAVSKCCHKDQKSHRGFHWMFYDDYLKLN